MKERPILFSGPMVRALLDGRKTQTRRVVKPQPPTPEQFRGSDFGLDRAIADGVKLYSQNDYDRLPKHPTDWSLIGSVGVARTAGFPMRYRCPYGAPGDRLWVRESWQLHERFSDLGRVVYAASANRSWSEAHADFPIDTIGDLKARPFQEGLRPSLHMPRWASRLTLEITDVRVERLQDISEADAMAEGASPCANGVWFDGKPEFAGCDARGAYYCLWEHINGAGSWAANPWAWAVSFRVVEQGG